MEDTEEWRRITAKEEVRDKRAGVTIVEALIAVCGTTWPEAHLIQRPCCKADRYCFRTGAKSNFNFNYRALSVCADFVRTEFVSILLRICCSPIFKYFCGALNICISIKF